MNEEVDGRNPKVLLLGEIVLAHQQWNTLKDIALVKVSELQIDPIVQ